ncbi:hypothetical protein D3C80_172010 [compost metagenome]
MISSEQIRAARALLGWSQETLAEQAVVSLTALKRLESKSGLRVFESTEDRIRRTLENAGIMFLTSDQGVGVMLMKQKKSTNKP